MKNIFKIIFTVVFITTFVSCDETIDPVIYTGDESLERTFLSFPSSIVNLPVTIDATGTVEITLNSSTKSAVERIFSINLIDSLTTANPLTYDLPAFVTIPANAYQSTFTLTGTDNDLVEPAAKQLAFSLGNLPEGTDYDSNLVTVNIFEVCPILSDFSGNYLIEQITPINPCDGVLMFENQVVQVENTGESSRTFAAIYLEAFSSTFPLLNINFSLVCNDVIVGVSDSGLGCSGGTLPPINVGPAVTPGTYASLDDSVFEVTISEYYTEDGGCDCIPYDTTFRFTKQ